MTDETDGEVSAETAPDPDSSDAAADAAAKAERKAQKEERLRGERELLVRALAEARGNKAEAARALGMARSTFLSRLQKHGLQ